MQASLSGEVLTLTPLEYRFLHILVHSAGKPVGSGELSEALHGVDKVDTNAIEALVVRLRRKVGGGVIQTRRGFGYVLAGAA